jgi:hypothetical protein
LNDNSVYVPVLKAKDAELKALGALVPRVKDRIHPLLEVMPEGVADVKTGTRKSLDTHLAKTHARIVKCWGTSSPMFVDFIVDRGRVVGKKTVAKRVFDDFIADGVKFVPVTSLDASLPYQDEVRNAIRSTGSGACIRLRYQDFDPRVLPRRIEELRQFLGLGYAGTDVVIDLREINEEQVPPMVLAVQAVLAALPGVDQLRSLTVASAAFPRHIGDCERDAVTSLPRADWQLWGELRARAASLPRVPIYGDYGVTNPEFTEFDPKTMRVSAQMRYTTDDDFLVAKGRAIGFAPPTQTVAICSWIATRKEFRGGQFSAGDKYIADRAAGGATPGNPTTWLWAGTTHHLTLTQDQIAKQGAP